MELNEYQDKAMLTCMYTCDNLTYMLLNLVGEVGEFASKVAKHVRKGELNVKVFKRSGMVLAISLMGVIVFPSKRDLLLIYGVGTTLDYIQKNETAKQLPDKCIKALDAWVESLNDKNEK